MDRGPNRRAEQMSHDRVLHWSVIIIIIISIIIF